jgi:hypothetical protein
MHPQRAVEASLNTILFAVKTPEGLAELNTRRRGLSQRHRTLLHFADGKRSEAQWRSMGEQAGIPDSCFSELLALGLVELHAAVAPVRSDVAPTRKQAPPAAPDADWRAGATADSELPPLRTLPPASAFLDSATGSPVSAGPWFQADLAEQQAAEAALERARDILLRVLRHEAPLAGLLTSLRLRRARSHEELHALLDEIEARADQTRRSLSTSLALQQARSVLGGPRALAWISR